MKNKIILIAVVVVLAVGGFFGVKALTAQETNENLKEITVVITAETESIDVTYTWETEQEYLFELLVDYTDTINLGYDETAYGNMIVALEGFDTTDTTTYWAINVNGEASMVGADDVALNDGDEIEFILTDFS